MLLQEEARESRSTSARWRLTTSSSLISIRNLRKSIEDLMPSWLTPIEDNRFNREMRRISKRNRESRELKSTQFQTNIFTIFSTATSIRPALNLESLMICKMLRRVSRDLKSTAPRCHKLSWNLDLLAQSPKKMNSSCSLISGSLSVVTQRDKELFLSVTARISWELLKISTIKILSTQREEALKLIQRISEEKLKMDYYSNLLKSSLSLDSIDIYTPIDRTSLLIWRSRTMLRDQFRSRDLENNTNISQQSLWRLRDSPTKREWAYR